MINSSTAPISNVKLKWVSKLYHVFYNDRLGKKLLTNVKVQTNPQETSKRSYIAFIWLQIIVSIGKYHAFPLYTFTNLYSFTYRYFFNRLSIKVSYSVQHVKCARKYCINKPCHKLHHYISACSTCHHTLLHNPTILNTKTFFAIACQMNHKILYKTNMSHSTLVNFLARLIQLKHIFHQVGSFPSW